jgi:hypothetical protein
MRVGVGKRSRLARGLAVAAVTLTTGARVPGGTAWRPLLVGSRTVYDVALEEETGGSARAATTWLSVDAGALREVARARAAPDTLERHASAYAVAEARSGSDEVRLASGRFESRQSLARAGGPVEVAVVRELVIEDGAGERRARRLLEVRTLKSRGAIELRSTRPRESRGDTPWAGKPPSSESPIS